MHCAVVEDQQGVSCLQPRSHRRRGCLTMDACHGSCSCFATLNVPLRRHQDMLLVAIFMTIESTMYCARVSSGLIPYNCLILSTFACFGSACISTSSPLMSSLSFPTSSSVALNFATSIFSDLGEIPNLLSDSTMCLLPERLCSSSACSDRVTRSPLAFAVSALLAATFSGNRSITSSPSTTVASGSNFPAFMRSSSSLLLAT
mmetsp:Transcript_9547/g.58168  ORF Transcript_9547/g.58168 Transcript_9547/m.58168 type:complete len:203 (+) Transcript_9547:853-1461(+)